MNFLKKILFVVMLGVFNVFSVNAEFKISKQIELPPEWNAEDNSDFYSIRVDSDDDKVCICFPKNGKQPGSENAAKYSCASIKDERVTCWYIWAFGGNLALNAVYGREKRYARNLGSMMSVAGFSPYGVSENFDHYTSSLKNIVCQPNRTNIINLSSFQNSDQKTFWKMFKEIAETPIGRVLLYRLLIEINRIAVKEGTDTQGKFDYVEAHSGAIEGREPEKVVQFVNARNFCRSIVVSTDNTADSNFSWRDRKISLGSSPITALVLIDNYAKMLSTVSTKTEPVSPDTVLFHEMLHWFHFLRDPVQYQGNDLNKYSDYIFLSYYGDISELSIWSVIKPSPDIEEMKTILGTPNWKDDRISDFICSAAILCTSKKYREGDDLSENAYRISKNIGNSNEYKIRFGHINAKIPRFFFNLNDQSFPGNRFFLARICAILAARKASCVAD